jgi:hypothetical protein
MHSPLNHLRRNQLFAIYIEQRLCQKVTNLLHPANHAVITAYFRLAIKLRAATNVYKIVILACSIFNFVIFEKRSPHNSAERRLAGIN